MAKILVIEDQDSLGLLYKRVLGSVGHDVTVAQTGCAGVVAAENNKPDLVFLDLMLPGMKGTEVAQQLTQVGTVPDSPLVITTAMAEFEVKALAPYLGAAVKPFDIRTVFDLVESLLPKPKEQLASSGFLNVCGKRLF